MYVSYVISVQVSSFETPTNKHAAHKTPESILVVGRAYVPPNCTMVKIAATHRLITIFAEPYEGGFTVVYDHEKHCCEWLVGKLAVSAAI